MRIWLDIETYCELDIRKVGAYRYCEHDSFEILMCAYAVDDEPVRVAVGALELLEQVEPLLDMMSTRPDVTYVAHNSTFERVAFSKYYGLPVGEYLPPSSWTDTMPMAAAESYPQGLGNLAKALKVKQKDSAGTLLINLFSQPNRKGGRNTALTHPEKWQQFVDYCANDVETMRECGRKLPDQSPVEREVWIADQLINDRGIRLDLPMAQAAVDAAEENKAAAIAEVRELTGVENPKSVQQLQTWFQEQRGLILADLRADTVRDLLADPLGLEPVERRVLELRQELALSASAKYEAAVKMSNSDGRFRGSARYYGAHTGRWAGRGIQLQNLPRASLKEREPLAILDLMCGLGASPDALKALIRPLLTGPLTVVDYSAIEARVTAWLAGEEWMLEEFRGDGKIYERTAERMGIPDPYGEGRQSGKVASLALGFAGGIGALKKMGGESLGDDDVLQGIVDRWRKASPNIKAFWYELWDAFRSPDGGTAGPITVHAEKGLRRVELPSGRHIVYRGVRRARDPETHKSYLCFKHPTGKTPRLWVGVIVENAVQGIARDLLAYSLPRIEAAGIPAVAHVHDEVVAEGHHLEQLTKIMTEVPPWAEGLPLNASGDVKMRYAK